VSHRVGQAVVAGVVLILLAGCAAGNGDYSAADQAGFFSGVWHGWIAPFALIAHIFDRDVRIYEVANTGIWYDVGFYLAVTAGFGSLSLRRASRRSRRRAKRRVEEARARE